MIDINSNFSFKFVDQDQVFKEIKKLCGNKDSQKIDIPIEIMKKNIDISFIFCIIISITPYLTLSFQGN